MADISVGAYIVNDRWRHDIVNDHFDDMSTLQVAIEAPIGPYGAGTPLHYVLEALMQRMIRLESRNVQNFGFSADAYLLAHGGSVESGGTTTAVVSSDAVLAGGSSGSLTADSAFAFAFVMSAVLGGYDEFGVNAVIA